MAEISQSGDREMASTEGIIEQDNVIPVDNKDGGGVVKDLTI